MTRDICLNVDRSRISPAILSYFHPGEVGRELDEAGIPWFVCPRIPKFPFPFWRFLRKLVLKRDIDAVISMGHGPNLDNVIVTPAIRKVGCVMRVTTAEPPARIVKTEGRLSRKAHLLVYPSQYSADANAGNFAIPSERVRILPNGCNTERFEYVAYSERRKMRRGLGLPEDAFVFYSAARVNSVKGQDVMAEAMALIHEELKRRNAIWVNTGLVQNEPLAANLKALAGKAAERIFIKPPVRNPEAYVAAADAAVIPSRNESFCIAALEALSVGRIFVGTDCGVMPAIAAPTGAIIVRRGSAEALAEGLIRLLDMPETEFERLGEKAADYVRQSYSIKAAADAYAGVIEEAVEMAVRRKGR